MLIVWHLVEQLATLQCGLLKGHIDAGQPQAGLRGLELGDYEFSPAALLQAHFAAEAAQLPALEETYVRGDDLIAAYRATSERPLRAQVYWRAICDDAALENGALQAPLFGVELVLSQQTHLLDSAPTMHAESHLPVGSLYRLAASPTDVPANGNLVRAVVVDTPLPADDILLANDAWQPVKTSVSLHRAPCVILFRPQAVAEVSYVEMVFPADVDLSEWTAGDNGTWQLKHSLFAEPLEKGVIRRVRLRGMFMPRERDTEWAAYCYQRFLAAPLPLTA